MQMVYKTSCKCNKPHCDVCMFLNKLSELDKTINSRHFRLLNRMSSRKHNTRGLIFIAHAYVVDDNYDYAAT